MNNQVEVIIAIALMVMGVVLFVVGRVSASKSVHVSATDGSVAVGRDNSGSIVNIKNAPPGAPAQHGSHMLTKVAIAVELVGIGVGLLHLWHQAHP